MKIEKIIKFFFMVDVMMILGSFYKTDMFRPEITAILVGFGVALLVLLWIVTSIKNNRMNKGFQQDKSKSRLKKIKVLFVLSLILVFASVYAIFVFDGLKNTPVPSYCKDFCNPTIDACSDETYENLDLTGDNLSDFLKKAFACEEKMKPMCSECRVKNQPLVLKAEMKIAKYRDYSEYSYFAAGVFSVITLLSITSYLAVKFSFVRTIGAISILWVIFVFSQGWYMQDSLVYTAPVMLFWLYRFIRYGPLKMFKD
jgi:hypothetical protein